jgi:methylthioribose-1-phosphate isomerase
MLPTIAWQDGEVVMIDQRKLPGQEVYLHCKTANEVAKAIRTMVIRGAPAIGVAAAMGIALGMGKSSAQGTRQFAVEFTKLCDLMAGTRPTAVNLFWAIERLKQSFAAGVQAGESVDQLKVRLAHEATAIHDEDVESCRTMGRFGADLVGPGARILTHCNAGSLATAGYGTALGVIRAAAEQGKVRQVYADETRPFLQGARLTAWELVRDRIPTTVITESMAGPLMKRGEIDVIVVGADRIAANGDVANKIGTYTVAILAGVHGVPFYVAAPLSTIDLRTADGDLIPIEERHAREMTHLGPVQITPEGAAVWNPAFDVTPHHLVTGIITERGVARPPYTESLRLLFELRQGPEAAREPRPEGTSESTPERIVDERARH